MTRWMIGVVWLMGCGGGEEGDGTTLGADEKLVELEALIDGFEDWPQVEVGIVPGETVHGAWIQNWPNEVAKAHIDAAAGGDMPDGAVLVKQGYDDEAGATKNNLTVMWKTEGEWYWAAWNPAGEVQASGFDLDSQCISCHEGDPDQQDLVISYDW